MVSKRLYGFYLTSYEQFQVFEKKWGKNGFYVRFNGIKIRFFEKNGRYISILKKKIKKQDIDCDFEAKKRLFSKQTILCYIFEKKN